jgi:hypothetical protein
MKRLIRKHSGLKMNELDEADIKQDRCPNCRNKPLKTKDGFKYCDNCEAIYKMFDGSAYVVRNHGGDKIDKPTTSHYDLL